MLKLWVGDRAFGDGSIDEIFDHIIRNRLEWFEDPFVHRIVKEIDNTTSINAFTLNSSVLGNISYERLSGGTKALILLYKEPSIDLWGTLLGDNCIPLLCEISEMHDITLKFSHIPRNFPENSKAFFLDNGEEANTGKEIMDGIFERIIKMRATMEDDLSTVEIHFMLKSYYDAISYDLKIQRKIIIIAGDSGIGKSDLIRLLMAKNKEKLKISVSCSYKVWVLTSAMFEIIGQDIKQVDLKYSDHDSENYCNAMRVLLKCYDNYLFFADEDFDYLNSFEFANFCKFTNSYYVLISREQLHELFNSCNCTFVQSNNGVNVLQYFQN